MRMLALVPERSQDTPPVSASNVAARRVHREQDCRAYCAPVLHQDAGQSGVQQSGEDARREDDGGAVAEAASCQQEGVVADVGLCADVLQAAQVPA